MGKEKKEKVAILLLVSCPKLLDYCLSGAEKTISPSSVGEGEIAVMGLGLFSIYLLEQSVGVSPLVHEV